MRRQAKRAHWWHFVGSESEPPSGEFLALPARDVGRLYFPLAGEHGLRTWVTPELQGSPALSHHEYVGVPLTAEDLSNNMIHRGVWLVRGKGEPFSLSRLSPQGLAVNPSESQTIINAGLGWFRVARPAFDGDLVIAATLWCPADFPAPIEVMLVEVKNRSKAVQRFGVYAALPLFGRSADRVRDHRHVSALLHRVEVQRHGMVLTPTMRFDERGHEINSTVYAAFGFGPGGSAPRTIWPTQVHFLHEGGSFAAPRVVWERETKFRVPNSEIQGKEALGGFWFGDFQLAREGTLRFALIQGASRDRSAVTRWVRWARNEQNLLRSLEYTKAYWLDRSRSITFGTPDWRLNNWLIWVNHQPELRRLYGNSYLPEFDYGRGGKGWRDLWQDCLALLLREPDHVASMLHRNFAGVRIDGSNATIITSEGDFIADRNNLPRTWMDHGCWPVLTTLLYVDQTGDWEFLLRKQQYFRDPQTHRCQRWDSTWDPSQGHVLRDAKGRVYEGTVLEHMLVQNLTAFFNVGEHNVCRLEGADWNDGLDMARERGESVAFSAFYAWNLRRLADTLRELRPLGVTDVEVFEELLLLLDRLPKSRRVNYGRPDAKRRRLEEYMDRVAKGITGRTVRLEVESVIDDLESKARDLSERIRTQEWLSLGRGMGCFNGYYDNRGQRVEGRQGNRVRMTLTGQVFPIMAGLASSKQVDALIKAVDYFLRDPVTKGIRLNTDFGSIQPALGRAFSFVYGDKENGAVFSHMAVMYAYALYRVRRAQDARRVWAPLYCAAMNTPSAKIFPCLPEYFNAQGRGMYCYLTGSASWLIYVLLTQAYGVRGEMGDLVLDPQLLADEFNASGEARVTCSFAGRRLEIVYRNRQRLGPERYQVQSIRANSEVIPFDRRMAGGVRVNRAQIAALPKKHVHLVEVELG